jgi:dipeptidyl aminopeptidase/acylaminoacyl peptidase
MGEQRLIQPDDLLYLSHADDVQFCPDGQSIVYTHVQPNASENRYNSALWLAWADARHAPRQLTFSGKDSQPRWSPDGQTLAFVSARGGTPQLYLLPMDGRGGEAQAVTAHINGVSQPAWSSDGRYIAFLGKVNADERQAEDEGRAIPATPEQKQAYFDPLIITTNPYREGTSYHDGRYSQIYVLDVQTQHVRRVTNADAHYSAPVWSPDGTTLYSTRIATVGGDEYWRKGDIFAINVATGAETPLLGGEQTLSDLSISPDGAFLAFNWRAGNDTISHYTLKTYRLRDGAQATLNGTLDRAASAYRWLSDGRVLMVVQSEGRTPLYAVAPDGTNLHAVLTLEAMISAFSVAPNGACAWVASEHTLPCDVYAWQGTGEPLRLTRLNDDFLASVRVLPAHELRYTSEEGVSVQGWYILPPNYEAGKAYPLAVNIHGGPHVMWSCHERTMWHEWQTHAAQGYVVFYCNPRGSEGYGDSFIKALGNRWGEVAMTDIMAGVNALIAQGIADPDKLFITGGSYGGYMVAWITAHTHAFKAAVTQRGVYNLISFYGTTDIPTFAHDEFKTTPEEDHALLWQSSPLAYVQNIHTPMLIIHSENDFRVPIEQGEQLFSHLRRLGRKVRFVRFPREGHELSRSGEPTHRIRRISEMVDWWNAHLPS